MRSSTAQYTLLQNFFKCVGAQTVRGDNCARQYNTHSSFVVETANINISIQILCHSQLCSVPNSATTARIVRGPRNVAVNRCLFQSTTFPASSQRQRVAVRWSTVCCVDAASSTTSTAQPAFRQTVAEEAREKSRNGHGEAPPAPAQLPFTTPTPNKFNEQASLVTS